MKIPSYLRSKRPVLVAAILGGLVTITNFAPAQVWLATTAPELPWRAVAASADFTKLVAVGYLIRDNGPLPGFIYTSADSGATWVQSPAPSEPWEAAASSADGTKLVSVSSLRGGGRILSSADAGIHWAVTSAPINAWRSVASSADGSKLVAAVGDSMAGPIYTSADSGTTWTQTAAPTNSFWSSVASSADGTKLVAAGSSIYTSTNSGATWTQTGAPTNGWNSVACSADGSRFVAATGDGGIYVSADSGTSWSATWPPTGYGGTLVASSADGAILAAAANDTMVYTSTDSGKTWRASDWPNSRWAAALALAADGHKLIAAGLQSLNAGFLWTSPYSGPWRLAKATLENWQTWASVATSGDGTRLVAVPYYGTIYSSSDSGETWSWTSAPTNNWSHVVSSVDGTKLVATGSWAGPLIYRSSDSGTTWVRANAQTNSNNHWVSIATSADGTKLTAATQLGEIHASGDAGANWFRTSAPSNVWTSVASSADGRKLVATAGTTRSNYITGGIYTSPDSGATWQGTSALRNFWTSVASSADGTRLVAAAIDLAGYGSAYLSYSIYISSDSGTTWVRTSAPTNFPWLAVGSSADGTTLVAIAEDDTMIYISKDSGVTWAHADAPVYFWRAIACSANGSNIVAANAGNASGLGDSIYTLRSPIPPLPPPSSTRLHIGHSGPDPDISWLVPSTSFVLQQNPDLTTTNWTEVQTPPTLDFTNLHYEVTVPPSPGSRYYRLKQQQ